jgi:hypothetical protein
MGDVIKHASHGSMGMLIIEPPGSSWVTDSNSNASANIMAGSSTNYTLLFREHALLYQDDLSVLKKDTQSHATMALPNMGNEE